MAQSVSVNSRGTPSKNWIGKAPEDILTVKFDFGLFFDGSATSHTSSVTGELGIESSALLDNIVTVVISGGENGGTPSLVVSATDGTETKQVSLEIVVDNFLDEATSSGSGGGGVPVGGGDTITAFEFDLDGVTLRITTDQNEWPVDLTPFDQSAHVARTDNPHSVTKAQVGLSEVDNTSDVDKPVSSAQQTALDNKEGLLGNPASDGQVLSSTAAGVRSWVDRSAPLSIVELDNVLHTVTEDPGTIFRVDTATGNTRITLPVATDGALYYIKRKDLGAFIVELYTTGVETIDGSLTQTMSGGLRTSITLSGVAGVGWDII